MDEDATAVGTYVLRSYINHMHFCRMHIIIIIASYNNIIQFNNGHARDPTSYPLAHACMNETF